MKRPLKTLANLSLSLVLAGVIGFAVIYLVSQVGQRLAVEQTRHLITLIEDALDTRIAQA